jgi:hypothetical protein
MPTVSLTSAPRSFMNTSQPTCLYGALAGAQLCVRVENGVLAEHWDVIQDEATRASSKSGLPTFASDFLLNATCFNEKPETKRSNCIC